LTHIFTIIFWAFIFWVSIQYLYVLLLFRRVFTQQSVNFEVDVEPVSVIICARNEAVNLERNLADVLRQQYCDAQGLPMFEVIVVDDESTDGTALLLQNYCSVYSHLKVVTIPPGTPHTLKGKKFALSQGVAKASSEILLLTDADCAPASAYWLELMTAPIRAGKDIAAGYGAYRATSGILNAFSRWEALHSFLQLEAYALQGMPYMASGRNIACRSTLLQEAQSTPIWNVSSSGDDDLLVRLFGNKHNYAVVTSPAAFTYTNAQRDFKSYARQKQRHLTDGKNYRPLVQYLLGSYGFTHAAAWVYFFPLLLSSYWWIAVALMAIRCFMYWVIWARFAVRMREHRLSWYLPFFDFGWMLFNFAFLPYIVLKNKQHWK
jgi:glycosyltransferase involved in cell wall biosynthesis